MIRLAAPVALSKHGYRMRRLVSASMVGALLLAGCKPAGYEPYKSRFPSKEERERAASEAQQAQEQDESRIAAAAYSQEAMKLAVDEVRDSIRICIYDKLQHGCDKLTSALKDISSMTTDKTPCGRAASGLSFDTMMTGMDGESYLEKFRAQMLKDFSQITQHCR